MIDLHQLRTFMLVADRKSFTEAAEALLLTQPTVSSHIRHLEEKLGTALFDRLPRGVELTGAGRILYRHGRDLLRLQQNAVNELQEYCGSVTGHLEVGGSTIPGEYLLPGLIGRYREAVPGVDITLRIADTREITSQVSEGALEVALVGAAPESDALEGVPFCRDTLVLILPPGHPAAGASRSMPWERLLEQPLWLREPGSGTRKVLERALIERGKTLANLRVLGQMGSTEAVKGAVAAGLGMSVVSSLAVRQDLRCGRLAALALRGLNLRREFFLISHRHRTLSPAARRFRSFLLEEARPGGTAARPRPFTSSRNRRKRP